MNPSQRIILFAHHRSGLLALDALRQAGHEVVACFTHEPAPAWAGSIAQACAEARIPCSADPAAEADAEPFSAIRPDLVLSVGYRRRIGAAFLNLPRAGAYAVHPAPLPQYRGADPIPWAIINDEPAWSVSVYLMTRDMGCGPLVHRRAVGLRPSDNGYDLRVRCAEEQAAALIEALPHLAYGDVSFAPQDGREGRCWAGRAPFGGSIDWRQPAGRIAAFIRALDMGRPTASGYEHLALPALASVDGTMFGVWRARAGGTCSPYAPGTITRCDDQAWVQAGAGHIVLDQVLDAAGRDRPAAEFLQSLGLDAGDSLDSAHTWQLPPGRAITAAA